MSQLLADDNFPRPVVRELRRLGHDIIGLDETGLVSHESVDEDVLRAAAATDRSLLTLDYRSFSSLPPTNDHRPGVIICTFDPDFVGQASRIDSTLADHDSLAGQIIRIGRRRKVSA